MNKIINYILYFVMLCAGTSCIYEDAPEELNESEKGSTYFNLGFTTRAIDITDDGGINNLSLWFVKKGDKFATFYKEYEKKDLNFKKGSKEGDYYYVIQDKLSSANIGNYTVYAVINKTQKNNNIDGIPFGFEIDEKLITLDKNFDTTTFDNVYFGDNIRYIIDQNSIYRNYVGIPIFGKSQLILTEQNNSPTNAATSIVESTRSLAKIEILFAKKKKNIQFNIQGITLQNLPKISYLTGEKNKTLEILNPKGNQINYIDTISENAIDLLQLIDEKLIVSDENVTSGFGSNDLPKFKPSNISLPYILPNPFPKNTNTSANADKVYIPSGKYDWNDGGYQLQIYYDYGGDSYITKVNLPSINRNDFFKLYVLADQKEENKADIQVKVMNWKTINVPPIYYE